MAHKSALSPLLRSPKTCQKGVQAWPKRGAKMFGSWRIGKPTQGRLVAAVFVATWLSTLTASAEPSGITAPTPKGSIAVAYPAQAHGDAVVDLVLLLAEDGTVAQAEVKQGDAPFAEAARSAA